MPKCILEQSIKIKDYLSKIKKPVKTNLLKARKDANEKALKSGFMKMPDYVKKTFEEKEEEDDEEDHVEEEEEAEEQYEGEEEETY